MARYIDADKLVVWCNETYQVQSTSSGKAYINDFLTKVLSCPSANVAPIADTITEICFRFAVHFSTYTENATVKIKHLFRFLDDMKKEMLEGTQND
jgi:hypothetical protein